MVATAAPLEWGSAGTNEPGLTVLVFAAFRAVGIADLRDPTRATTTQTPRRHVVKRKVGGLLAVAALIAASAVPAGATTPPGQKGYEGKPGNQGGYHHAGQQGYEGQPGNQGGH